LIRLDNYREVLVIPNIFPEHRFHFGLFSLQLLQLILIQLFHPQLIFLQVVLH
jgi:hypothetical protein